MRDIAWAIVTLAGAVIFAAGVHGNGRIDSSACFLGALVVAVGLAPLIFFKPRGD